MIVAQQLHRVGSFHFAITQFLRAEEMASTFVKLFLMRRLSRALKSPKFSSSSSSSSTLIRKSCLCSSPYLLEASKGARSPPLLPLSRGFCSRPLNLDGEEGPTTINYRSLLQEDEFHKIADSTIHDLLEKLEGYGDSIDIDGFDIDFGNQVLTLKLGSLGTYVLNKQTPNRQIWLSSPVSGPSRFDWDRDAQAWVYRRTKAKLLTLLESELEKQCGQPIDLS